MGKEVFFKIIELPTHQVLFTKDFAEVEDEDCPVISITFFIEGAKVCQTMSYANEEKRDEMFDKLTEQHAQQTVDTVLKMINE